MPKLFVVGTAADKSSRIVEAETSSDKLRSWSPVFAMLLGGAIVASFNGCSGETQVATPTENSSVDLADDSEQISTEQAERTIGQWIEQANQLESEFKFDEAVPVWEQISKLVNAKTGADSWQATNARLSLETAKKQSEFSAQQLGLLRQFGEKQAEATRQLESGLTNQVVANINWMISAAEQLLGKDSHTIGRLKLQLGQTLFQTGKFIEAEQSLREALTVNQKQLGEFHPETDTNMFLLGQSFMKLGEFELGCRALEQSEFISQKLWGPQHMTTASRKNDLGVAYHAAGKMQLAEQKLDEALALIRERMPDNHMEIGETLRNLGVVHLDQKNFPLAKAALSEAVELLSSSVGESSVMTLDSRANLATINMLNKEYLAAEGQLRQVVQEYESGSKDSPALAKACYQLAVALGYQGQYHEAEPLLNRALNIQRKELGQWHAETVKTMQTLATLYERTGQKEQAKAVNEALNNFNQRSQSQN